MKSNQIPQNWSTHLVFFFVCVLQFFIFFSSNFFLCNGLLGRTRSIFECALDSRLIRLSVICRPILLSSPPSPHTHLFFTQYLWQKFSCKNGWNLGLHQRTGLSDSFWEFLHWLLPVTTSLLHSLFHPTVPTSATGAVIFEFKFVWTKPTKLAGLEAFQF